MTEWSQKIWFWWLAGHDTLDMARMSGKPEHVCERILHVLMDERERQGVKARSKFRALDTGAS